MFERSVGLIIASSRPSLRNHTGSGPSDRIGPVPEKRSEQRRVCLIGAATGDAYVAARVGPRICSRFPAFPFRLTGQTFANLTFRSSRRRPAGMYKDAWIAGYVPSGRLGEGSIDERVSTEIGHAPT